MDQHIQDLLTKRNIYRELKDFQKADEVRKEIESLGFMIVDEKDSSYVIDQTSSTRSTSTHHSNFLILFGSGEISPTGRKVHEYIFQKMNKSSISIGIITSPAGFQPNVVAVHEEIAAFFKKSLVNFYPTVRIIYANTPEDANSEKIIDQLTGLDYIFIGPGSPTYAVRVLKDSKLFDVISDNISNGASLCLASAATIAFSHMVLPVYEIYKVGEPLHWKEGLNFFKNFNQPNRIFIPHFNNTEGGSNLDTTHCYMGEKRFESLRRQLPNTEEVIGIDEHTALIFEKDSDNNLVMGKGTTHKI